MQASPSHRFHTSFAPHHKSPAIHVSEGVMVGGRVTVRTSQPQRVMRALWTGHTAGRCACAAWRASVPNPNMQYCNKSNMLHTAVWFGGSNVSCKCHKARTLLALQSEKGLPSMVTVESRTYAPPPCVRTNGGPFEMGRMVKHQTAGMRVLGRRMKGAVVPAWIEEGLCEVRG